MYISTSVWMPHTLNVKKGEKEGKMGQNEEKNVFFGLASKCWSKDLKGISVEPERKKDLTLQLVE